MLRLGDARRILVVEAHPDDAEIGVGATLARLARAGAAIEIVSLTGGENGTGTAAVAPDDVRSQREREAKAAAAVLGAEAVRLLPFEDMRLADTPETRASVITEIRRVRPDTVFALDPSLADEGHPDHIAAGRIALAAAIFAGFPRAPKADGEPWRCARVVLYATDRPNLVFEVSSTWSLKWEAVSLHASQFPPAELEPLRAAVTVAARRFARRARRRLAEPLRLLAPYQLHMYALPIAGDGAGLMSE